MSTNNVTLLLFFILLFFFNISACLMRANVCVRVCVCPYNNIKRENETQNFYHQILF